MIIPSTFPTEQRNLEAVLSPSTSKIITKQKWH